tara:strand:- start:406 stop:993 length:588 start_codon:yes stop_codon:yes gene_type:complete
LKKLYEESKGSESYILKMWDIGHSLGFDKSSISDIVQYLRGEQLVESRTLGGGISITHYGIQEIEESLENPNDPTEHFLPFNIINIGTMNNSSIQQGNVGSTQNNYFPTENLGDLKVLISRIEELTSLIQDKDLLSEIESENNTLKLQVNSPKPKSGIIRESLKSLKNIFTKVVTDSTTTGLVELINSLMEKIPS